MARRRKPGVAMETLVPKTPLTGSLHSPPLPRIAGERKRSFGDWRFLSPGQGGPKDGRDRWLAPERWRAKRVGEGVILLAHTAPHRPLEPGKAFLGKSGSMGVHAAAIAPRGAARTPIFLGRE